MLTDSPLMVIPNSTPLLLGSLTWKVPLLGTTDSNLDLKGKAKKLAGEYKYCNKISQWEVDLLPWYLRCQIQSPRWPCWPEQSPWVADGLPPKCHLQSGSHLWTAAGPRPAAAHTFTQKEKDDNAFLALYIIKNKVWCYYHPVTFIPNDISCEFIIGLQLLS